MANGGLIVVTPRPALAPFGLINTETVVDETDAHWAGGYTQENTGCNLYGAVHDMCDYNTRGDSIGTAPGADPDEDSYARSYHPYTLEAAEGCRSSFGAREDRQAKALEALELLTPKLLERAFWGVGSYGTTDSAANFTLRSSSPHVLFNGSAQKPRRAIAALEQALADDGAGTLGAIHVTRDLLSLLKFDVGDAPANDVMYTPGGSLLIGGVGYTGDGPSSARTDNQVWAYATGPVHVRLDAPQVEDVPTGISNTNGTERFYTTNTLVYTATRSASVSVNGCKVHAVLVNLDA